MFHPPLKRPCLTYFYRSAVTGLLHARGSQGRIVQRQGRLQGRIDMGKYVHQGRIHFASLQVKAIKGRITSKTSGNTSHTRAHTRIEGLTEESVYPTLSRLIERRPS